MRRIHEKCEQRHLYWFCLDCIYFFSLHQAKKDASGLPWQQATSQTLTKFIKKILKHLPLTFETTFKCTIFIQLEETLKPNFRPFPC